MQAFSVWSPSIPPSLHPSLPPPSLPPPSLPTQPPACQELIKKLLGATDEEMADELKKVESWSFGKVSPTPQPYSLPPHPQLYSVYQPTPSLVLRMPHVAKETVLATYHDLGW